MTKEHKDECRCGHNHSHDHDHGHDHSHDNAHSHDHDHDHNHSHDHDHDHNHSHDPGSNDHPDHGGFHVHSHGSVERGYDHPLIDGDDDCSCACSHHPEDEESKAVVTQMVFQLDEVIALSSGPVYGEFMANVSLQRRLIDLLDKVQAEAISLPEDFKNRKPKADWEFLQTLNSQIIHPVFGMNPETLWDVVRLEIPYQHKMLGIIVNGCSHDH